MKIVFALFTLLLLAACEEHDHSYHSHRHVAYVHDRPYYGGGYYARDRYYDRGIYNDEPVYRVDSRRRYYDDAPRSRVIIGY